MLDMSTKLNRAFLKYSLNIEGTLDKSTPYSSFLDSVNSFRDQGMLSVELNFEEDITVDELVEDQGVRHKSCYLKFNKKRSKGDNTRCSNDGIKRYKRSSMDKMSSVFCSSVAIRMSHNLIFIQCSKFMKMSMFF